MNSIAKEKDGPCPIDMELQISDLPHLPQKMAEYEHRSGGVEATHLVVGPDDYVGVGTVYGLGVIHAEVANPFLTNDPDYWANYEGTKG